MPVNPKLLGEGEQEILHLRTHPKRLAWPIVALLLTATVLGSVIALIRRYATASTQGAFVATAVIVAVLIVVAATIVPWLRWLTTTYTITTRRIITRRGLLSRTGHDLPLARINDVSYEMSVLDRMFGCGTLVLQTAAEDPVTLDDVPHVERVHLQLNEVLYGPQPRADHRG